jgi:proteasome lid subunit RPN8/RPN11
VPAALRRRLEEHADREAPNEACGFVVLRDGVAVDFIPCVNTAESPYRFELRAPDPGLILDVEDDGGELAVWHSHPTDSARPSKTDLANIGLWEERPYLILSRPTRELLGWVITAGVAEPLPLDLVD